LAREGDKNMAAETWEFDHTHSGIHFSVRHMVVARVRGHFAKWSGKLALDFANPAASTVSVQIDASSIDTREPQRDTHLRSADFLDVEKHPTIDFVSKRVESVGGEKFRLAGDLTIRGTTHEVVLDVEFAGRQKDPWGGERAGFSATTKIDRKDFGLTWNQVLEAGGILVGDQVEITIEVEAKKAA
jgi:polyisoprenoid-binding protein YceI